MHVRDIRGRIIRTLTQAPTDFISIPSLGIAADRYADSLGHTAYVILLLHHTYLQASLLPTAREFFVNEISSRGMPLVEVEFYWDMIHISYSSEQYSPQYRQRLRLGVE